MHDWRANMQNNEHQKPKFPPKLFGLRFDQWTAVLCCMIAGCQFYALINKMSFAGHDLRLFIGIAIVLLGPTYCLLTLKRSPFLKL